MCSTFSTKNKTENGGTKMCDIWAIQEIKKVLERQLF